MGSAIADGGKQEQVWRTIGEAERNQEERERWHS